MTPSLPDLIPALINWSHEHSNHFKVKVRHILERLIRKFGYENIERYVPEDDKKLVSGIRKKQARAKKRKNAEDADGDEEMEGVNGDDVEDAPKVKVVGRSAYDEVLYGSDSELSGADTDGEEEEKVGKGGAKNRKALQRKNKKEEGAFIHESEDEVLDLLDDRMMSKISGESSSHLSKAVDLFHSFCPAARPAPAQETRKSLSSHFKTDTTSGRIRFNEDDNSSDDERAVADGAISSMGAYLEAMKGEDGHSRDSKGRVKFNKTQGKRGRGDVDDDGGEVTAGLKELDVSGGRRNKKVKKEPVRVGAEFKAKVSTSISTFLAH